MPPKSLPRIKEEPYPLPLSVKMKEKKRKRPATEQAESEGAGYWAIIKKVPDALLIGKVSRNTPLLIWGNHLILSFSASMLCWCNADRMADTFTKTTLMALK
jgi:hypothetical protein